MDNSPFCGLLTPAEIAAVKKRKRDGTLMARLEGSLPAEQLLAVKQPLVKQPQATGQPASAQQSQATGQPASAKQLSSGQPASAKQLPSGQPASAKQRSSGQLSQAIGCQTAAASPVAKNLTPSPTGQQLFCEFAVHDRVLVTRKADANGANARFFAKVCEAKHTADHVCEGGKHFVHLIGWYRPSVPINSLKPSVLSELNVFCTFEDLVPSIPPLPSDGDLLGPLDFPPKCFPVNGTTSLSDTWDIQHYHTK